MTASIENQGTIFDCFRFYIYFVTVLFYIIGMVIEVPQNTVYPKSETIFNILLKCKRTRYLTFSIFSVVAFLKLTQS